MDTDWPPPNIWRMNTKKRVFFVFKTPFAFFGRLSLGIYVNFRGGISRWIGKLVIHQSATKDNWGHYYEGLLLTLHIFQKSLDHVVFWHWLMVAPSLSNKKISSSVAAVPTGYDTSFWSKQLRSIYVKFAMLFCLAESLVNLAVLEFGLHIPKQLIMYMIYIYIR